MEGNAGTMDGVVGIEMVHTKGSAIIMVQVLPAGCVAGFACMAA